MDNSSGFIEAMGAGHIGIPDRCARIADGHTNYGMDWSVGEI